MRQRIDFCPRCCLGGFILFFAAPEEIMAFESFSLTCCIFPCMVTFADVVFVFVSFAVVLLLSPCSKCKPVQYGLKTTSKQEQIPCAALQHDLKEMVRTRLPRESEFPNTLGRWPWREVRGELLVTLTIPPHQKNPF